MLVDTSPGEDTPESGGVERGKGRRRGREGKVKEGGGRRRGEEEEGGRIKLFTTIVTL